MFPLPHKYLSWALVLAAISIAGCSNLDPWNQRTRTPASPSSAFVPPPVPASQLAQHQPARTNQAALSLTECIRIALERNPSTRSSWAAARSAAASAGQARSGYLPSVTLSSEGKRANPVELDGTTNVGARNTFDASFGVSYLLFDPARSARVSGADAQLLAANFRHNAALQDVALTVAENYYGLSAARSLQALSRETIAQRENHVALAEARYKSGQTAKSDVLRAQTEKADADFEAVKADAAVHISRSQLAAAMGLRVSERLEIVDPPETVPEQDLIVTESILDQLATTRPEIRAALAQVQAQQAQVKTAEARYWPAVSANAEAGWTSRDFPPDEDEWSVGVGISLPLFTGFDRGYQVLRAKADLEKAIADGETQLRGVELEVWTAYAGVVEARQGMAAAARLVESAEESARVAEGEYKSGVGSITGLIDAQTTRASARARLLQTRLYWYTARARLDRAIGRAVSEPPSTSSQEKETP